MNGQLRWKLAIRDSTLDATAKHVALTLDTWMDAHGHCFPERPTIARGASLSVRAVDAAVKRLEAAGFLTVKRSRGRHVNHYHASLSNGAAAAPFNGAGDARSVATNGAANDTSTVHLTTSNGAAAAPEAVKKPSTNPSPEPTPTLQELITAAQPKELHA